MDERERLLVVEHDEEDTECAGKRENGTEDEELILPGESISPPSRGEGYKQVAKAFAALGYTAFGGGGAHIGIFQRAFVEKRRWLSNRTFAELIALAQCLPGPSSTQVAVALASVRTNALGGCLGGFLFLHPGLILMSITGLFAAKLYAHPHPFVKAVSSGLSSAGVGLVANAAKNLMNELCTEKLTRFLAASAACISFYFTDAIVYPLLILFGGVASLICRRWGPRSMCPSSPGPSNSEFSWRQRQPSDQDISTEAIDVSSMGLSVRGGFSILVSWFVVLVGCVVGKRLTPYEGHLRLLHWFEAMYRAGSFIFGGGQVVLAMLYGEFVKHHKVCDDHGKHCEDVESEDSWLSGGQFFAGMGLVQSSPGPIFNLSAYIGTVAAVNAGEPVPLGIIVCWLGLLAPGISILLSALPLWARLRQLRVYQDVLPGLNATAAGLVGSAAMKMFIKARNISPWSEASTVLVLASFAAVSVLRVPPPLVVVCGGVLGILAEATGAK